MKFEFLNDYWKFYLQGTEITIILSIIAVLCGTVLGIGITLLRRCPVKPVKWIGGAYVEFIRGTPLLAQIYIVYVGVPILLRGYDIPDMAVAAIALCKTAAYFHSYSK